MKTCPYCRRDNLNNAVRCSDCGKPLPPAAHGSARHTAEAQPLRLGLGVAVFLIAVAVLGWLLFLAEISKRTTYERLRAELESRIAQHDEDAANMQRKLEKLQAKHETLWNDFFRLEAQDKELQAQNQKYAEQNRALERTIAKLEGMLQEKQIATAVSQRAAAVEGPLPTDLRLASGAVVQPLSGYGKGELSLNNQMPSDVVIKLARPSDGWCVAAFYVRSKDSYTLTGIPDGNYSLYYATGYDYDQLARDFKRGRSARKSNSSLDFATRGFGRFVSGEKITYTLGAALGNTSSTPVSGTEFDRYRASP
jgi:Skp family chaperone for outer membrane proteins